MAESPPQTALGTLKPGDAVRGTYRLKQCLLRQTPQGKHFILGELADGSGAVGLVWWNASGSDHERLRGAAYATVQAKAERYRDRLQLVVSALQPAEPDQAEVEALAPAPRCDIEAEWADLVALVDGLESEPLKALLRAILVDDAAIAEAFRAHPAAIVMHHPWPGGLLAHTVQMARAADLLCRLYPRLDRELLIAAVLLHDLCKIEEIDASGSYEYTTRGNLIGHVVLGSQLVFDRARSIEDFPPRLLERLQHCILAHHGQMEWGAAREPMLPEALALHYIDNLDARLEAAFRAIDESTSGDPEWTEFNRMLGVRIYRGDAT